MAGIRGGRTSVGSIAAPPTLRSLQFTLWALLALLLQSTVITRVHWPLGGPNLVFLLFIPWALKESPVRATIIGFAVGVALDILPPADGILGHWSLTCAITAYALSRYAEASRDIENSPLVETGVYVAGLMGLLLIWGFSGIIMGDVRAGIQFFGNELPKSFLWNAILAPIVIPLIRSRFGIRRMRK